jgi:hypothetical protein
MEAPEILNEAGKFQVGDCKATAQAAKSLAANFEEGSSAWEGL